MAALAVYACKSATPPTVIAGPEDVEAARAFAAAVPRSLVSVQAAADPAGAVIHAAGFRPLSMTRQSRLRRDSMSSAATRKPHGCATPGMTNADTNHGMAA